MLPSTVVGTPSEPLPILLTNTISIDRAGGVRDALEDITGIQHWVATIGPTSGLWPSDSPADVAGSGSAAKLLDLRDAIRRLFADETNDPRAIVGSPIGDVATARNILNESSALSAVWPELTSDESRPRRLDCWAAGSYADALTTVIARRTIDLMTGARRNDLQPCLAPNCAHYFLKDSFRRQWCTPACGNRARVARHAQRHRTSDPRISHA